MIENVGARGALSILLLSGAMLAASASAQQCIPYYGQLYTQDFDTLPTTGTGHTTLP